MDTKYTALQPGITYQVPGGNTTVTFGSGEAQGPASPVDTKGSGGGATPITPSKTDQAWIKHCKTLGAGMGTGLSWSFRPLMARITTETLIAGGIPPRLATAIGLMLSELVINPVVIPFGTTTAELISGRMQRLVTGGNISGPKSSDFAKDLANAINVGFTTMAFALAYQSAGKTTPAQTSWETYGPALQGGALTGALAMLTALMGKQIRQLDALMQEKQLEEGHDLVMETPSELAFEAPGDSKKADGDLEQGQPLVPRDGDQAGRASCGKRLCARLAMTGKDWAILKTFFKDRMEAAFEMNREMVLDVVPVLHAQILLAYVLPMINPARENILGLHDTEHMTRQTQYQLISALATALVHNKRVEGWTNYLTGTPVVKNDLNHTELGKLARQIVPALVNGAITLVSSYIASVASSPDKMSDSIKEQFAGWSDLGEGTPQQILQIAGGMLGCMLLLRLVAGSGEGLRMGGMVASGVSGALAGFTGSVPAQLGAVVGSVSHAMVRPTHDNLVLPKAKEEELRKDSKAGPREYAKAYAQGFAGDGALGYVKQIARPLRSMAQGGYHAIVHARSFVPAALGGAAGGALGGGLIAAGLTAGGIVSMPGVPVAFVAGAGASLAGTGLSLLAAYCRGASTVWPVKPDDKQPAPLNEDAFASRTQTGAQEKSDSDENLPTQLHQSPAKTGGN